MEDSFQVKIEDGSLVVETEEQAEIFEGAFIDWCARGYMEPKRILPDGRLSWKLTAYGREHINDILKVVPPAGTAI